MKARKIQMLRIALYSLQTQAMNSMAERQVVMTFPISNTPFAKAVALLGLDIKELVVVVPYFPSSRPVYIKEQTCRKGCAVVRFAVNHSFLNSAAESAMLSALNEADFESKDPAVRKLCRRLDRMVREALVNDPTMRRLASEYRNEHDSNSEKVDIEFVPTEDLK